jgi:hypothetical protein
MHLFHSMETSSSLPDKEPESRRFVLLFRRGASVVPVVTVTGRGNTMPGLMTGAID